MVVLHVVMIPARYNKFDPKVTVEGKRETQISVRLEFSTKTLHLRDTRASTAGFLE